MSKLHLGSLSSVRIFQNYFGFLAFKAMRFRPSCCSSGFFKISAAVVDSVFFHFFFKKLRTSFSPTQRVLASEKAAQVFWRQQMANCGFSSFADLRRCNPTFQNVTFCCVACPLKRRKAEVGLFCVLVFLLIKNLKAETLNLRLPQNRHSKSTFRSQMTDFE